MRKGIVRGSVSMKAGGVTMAPATKVGATKPASAKDKKTAAAARKPAAATKKVVAKKKIEPPVIGTRAGKEGQRFVTARFPDGAVIEVSFETNGSWHELRSDGLVLDRTEVLE